MKGDKYLEGSDTLLIEAFKVEDRPRTNDQRPTTHKSWQGRRSFMII